MEMPKAPQRKRLSASQSFNADEIEALSYIVENLVRGSNPSQIPNRSLGNLARKVRVMKNRIQALKTTSDLPATPSTTIDTVQPLL